MNSSPANAVPALTSLDGVERMAADPIASQLDRAIQLHQQGRLADASLRYHEILALDPNCADAQYLLGVVASQSNQPQAAITWIKQALARSPNNANYLRSLGIAYAQVKQYDDAEQVYVSILKDSPESAEVWNSLGNTYSQAGKFHEAASAFLRALSIRPDYVEAHYNYGLLLFRFGHHGEAQESLERAVRLQPSFAPAYQSLGHLYRVESLWPLAIQAYRQAVGCQPLSAEHRMDLANALQDSGAISQAINEYTQALALHPHHTVLLRNLGNAYRKNWAYGEAIRAYQKALELEPQNAETLFQLATAYQLQSKLPEARQAYLAVIAIDPKRADALYNLGLVLQELGENEAALASFHDCVRIDDKYPCAWSALVFLKQQLCDWEHLDEFSQNVIQSVERSESLAFKDLTTPLSFLAITTPSTPAQQLRCAQRWVEATCHVASPSQRPHDEAETSTNVRGFALRRAVRKLRIGYLSGDFQEHAVAFQMVECFEQHNRQQFEIFAYSFGFDDGGPTRRRIVNGVDHFRDLRDKPASDISQAITGDAIDILVDLQGHTKHARFEVLAHRPAKIQISYLGFAGTTGATFIDAVIGDDFATPPNLEPYFTEKIVRLPGCFMANDSQLQVSERCTRRIDYQLPEEAFVLCAFHSTYKISPKMFTLWMRLLLAVPRAVLWLGPMPAAARRNLLHRAMQQGIHAGRLVFASSLPRQEHIGRTRLADLFLDTFPYNAHTTACETLRVGVPLLTLSGEAFVSRVAGSVLNALGLQDLITFDDETYLQRAVELATRPEVLSTIQTRLRNALSNTDLFDGKAFARKIEAAFIQLALDKRSDLFE